MTRPRSAPAQAHRAPSSFTSTAPQALAHAKAPIGLVLHCLVQPRFSNDFGFFTEAIQQSGEFLARHGQLEVLAAVIRVEANVFQQAHVFDDSRLSRSAVVTSLCTPARSKRHSTHRSGANHLVDAPAQL